MRSHDHLKVMHYNTPCGYDNHRKKVVVNKDFAPDVETKWFYNMTVFVRRTNKKGLMFGLEQRLPGKVKDNDMVDKKKGFHYRWYSNGANITICRNLSSTKPDVIFNQAKILMKEVSRFFFMYCADSDEIVKATERPKEFDEVKDAIFS